MKRKIRKNPAPRFFNELHSLINKEVEVRCVSDFGYFSIVNKLIIDVSGRFYIDYDDLSKKFPIYARIMFERISVENIINAHGRTTIELISNKEFSYFEEKSEISKKLQKLVNHTISLKLHLSEFASVDMVSRLRYNKTDKIYYFQSSDLKLQFRFKSEAVWLITEKNLYMSI